MSLTSVSPPIALITLLAGCSSTVAAAGSTTPNRYQLLSAGHLGCPASDIAVTDFASDSSGSASWLAVCGGSTFVCSASAMAYACSERRE